MALNIINKSVQAMLMTPRPADKTHREYLVKLLGQYYNMLKESYVDLKQYEYKSISYAEILTCVKDICSKLLKVYDLYMHGDVAKSIQVMRDCFTRTDLRLIEQITSSNIMYRARVIDSTQCLLDSKSMFHIPVEKRSLIANNRFNISGYPCLYLGNSILACWEEMAKPNLEQFYVSQVELRNKKNKKVIDLRWDTSVDIPRITEDDGSQGAIKRKVVDFMFRIPLKIACSIPVFDPQLTFKEEYVIPQILLMSCIGNKNVDGIAYTSTRRDDQISDDLSLHHNYVFPVQKIKDRGFCEKLTTDFQITHGISFMEADIKNVFHAKGTPNIYVENDTLHLDDIDQGKTEYQCTKFGQMEDYLKTQPRYSLKKIDGKWEEIPIEL